MILVDTAVWVDHLRAGVDALASALTRGEVLGHPWVAGELSLGNLRDREEVLRLLGQLPQATVASERELAAFIEVQELAGAGIGYVDAQVLASAMLSSALLWTRDRRLQAVAERLGCAYRS